MKKIGILFLVLAMVLGLWGCKSKEAASVEELISGIGAVSAGSGDAIAAAEEAWAALSEDDKTQVENYAVLEEARFSYHVLTVQDLIAAIGEVSETSESAITTAEEAYAALTEEEKAAVENVEALSQAQHTWKELQLSALLQGTWYTETTIFSEQNNSYKTLHVTLADLPSSTDRIPFTGASGDSTNLSIRSFTIMENQFYGGEYAEASVFIGTWEFSENLDSVIIHVEGEGLEKDTYTMDIREEDGFMKLCGDYPTDNSLAFVREEDLAAAFDAKYVHMQLTGENMQTYFGDPVDLGFLYDENGEKITSIVDEGSGETLAIGHVTIFPSKAYEQGLVYLDGGYFNFSLTYGGRSGNGRTDYPVILWADETVPQTLTGGSTACFIRADHVAKNYIDETGCRVLELTDGNVIRYESDEYVSVFCQIWKYLDVDYNDYIF